MHNCATARTPGKPPVAQCGPPAPSPQLLDHTRATPTACRPHLLVMRSSIFPASFWSSRVAAISGSGRTKRSGSCGWIVQPGCYGKDIGREGEVSGRSRLFASWKHSLRVAASVSTLSHGDFTVSNPMVSNSQQKTLADAGHPAPPPHPTPVHPCLSPLLHILCVHA